MKLSSYFNLSKNLQTLFTQPGILCLLALMMFSTDGLLAQCDSGYSTSPSSGTYSASATSGSFSVTIPDGCYWYPIVSDFDCSSWIFNVSTSPGSVSFSMLSNNSCSSRSCNIAIVNANSWSMATYSVTQLGQGSMDQPEIQTAPTEFCDPEPLTYSISEVDGATGYEWEFSGEGSISGNGTSITLNPESSGTLSVSPVNECGNGPTQYIDVDMLDIPALPNSISGPQNICAGDTNYYTVSNAPQSSSYNWSYNSQEVTSGSIDSIYFSPSESGVLTVTPENLCGIGPQQTLSITTQQIPSQPEEILGDTSVCVESDQTYSINPLENVEQYEWNLPPSWTGQSNSSSIDVITGMEGGTLQVSASNECGNSEVTNLEIEIPYSEITIDSILGPENLCANTEAELSVIPTSDTLEYIWTLPQSWDGEPEGSTLFVTNDGLSDTVSVQIFDGCNFSETVSQVIMVNEPTAPVSPISGNSNTCTETTEVYSVNEDPNADVYEWSIPDESWSGSSNESTIELQVGIDGGVLEVVSMNACDTSEVQSLSIQVDSIPADPTSIEGETLACIDEPSLFSTDEIYNANYYWTFSGAVQSSLTTFDNEVEVNWNDTGEQLVTVKTINGCGSGSTIEMDVTVETCTSVGELAEDTQWKLYPNPANDHLFIEKKGTSENSIVELIVLDSSGRIMISEKAQLTDGELQFDVSNLKRGFFILQLKNKKRITTIPFTKL